MNSLLLSLLVVASASTSDVFAVSAVVSSDERDKDTIYIHGESGIEIDEKRQQIRVFKNASVKRGDAALYGDVIYGYYVTLGKKLSLSKVEAFGSVKMTMPDKTLTAREGSYDLIKDVICFRGRVHVTEKNNHLQGDYATMDRKTGQTKVLSQDPTAPHPPLSPFTRPHTQVRVLLGPQRNQKIG